MENYGLICEVQISLSIQFYVTTIDYVVCMYVKSATQGKYKDFKIFIILKLTNKYREQVAT